MLNKAIGKNVRCIFINNGLLRRNEPEQIVNVFRNTFRLNLDHVDRSKKFLVR